MSSPVIGDSHRHQQVDLSFYDEPIETASTRYNSARFPHSLYEYGSSSTSSSSSSSTSIESDDESIGQATASYHGNSGEDRSIDYESDSCSSVEQVFLGKTQTAKEKAYLSKLASKLPPSTPIKVSTRLPRPPQLPAAENVAPLSQRLRKRDSREFNRRKTLAFSRRESIVVPSSGLLQQVPHTPLMQRVWAGGFFEKSKLRYRPS